MPSGAKKRKAAKKKKEKEEAATSTIHSSTKSQDALETHYEKESDSGELSSPASQEHHHHPLAQEQHQQEEEEKGDSTMEGSENIGHGEGGIEQRIEAEVEDVVQIDWEFKPDEDSESRSVSVEHVESVEESPNKGSSRNGGRSSSSSSSSSSSDDESPAIDKNLPVEESEKSEIVPTVEPEPVVSLSEEVIQVVEATPIENVGIVGEIDFVSEAKEDELLPSSNETSGPSGVIDSVLPPSEDNAGASGATDLGSEGNEYKLLPSSDAVNIGTSNGGEHSKKSDTRESSVNQPLLASSPPTERPTSWKNCCGLFDVLMGSSNR